jgi:DNA-directed RNA polymerase specialized sigma subunit
MHLLINQVKRAIQALTAECGSVPSDQQVAERLNLSESIS